MNMSYCRFENTARALRECIDALRDDEEAALLFESDLSSEWEYFTELIENCKEYLEEAEYLLKHPPKKE